LPPQIAPLLQRLNLSYNDKVKVQCKAVVKVHGSFRLSAATPHLHSDSTSLSLGSRQWASVTHSCSDFINFHGFPCTDYTFT